MADHEERWDESRRLTQMLVEVAERSKEEFTRVASEVGLPVHLARALFLMDEPAPMRDLATRLSCDRSYVTGIADQLEAAGLVVRVTGEDRRVKFLALTDSGRGVRQGLIEKFGERSLVMRRLSEAERTALAGVLERLLAEESERG